MMRVAITGATGVLGRHLVSQFRREPIRLFGRSEWRLRKTFRQAEHIEFVQTDYSADNLVKQLDRTDAVVHLAAVRPGKGMAGFTDYIDNVRVSENLFIACNRLAITNLVFASTGSIYSPEVNRLPFSEDQAVIPPSHYAISKLTSECLGHQYGLNIKSLRIAHVIAAEERDGYLLKTFINRARRGEPLIVFGQGSGRREYVHVKDVATAIAAAIQQPSLQGVINIGMGESISHREFAESVRDVFANGGVEIIEDKDRAEDAAQYMMDGTKAREVLKWEPKYTLRDALREIRRHYEKQSDSGKHDGTNDSAPGTVETTGGRHAKSDS